MGGEWLKTRFEQLLTGPVRNGVYKSKEFHGRGTKIVNMGELFSYPRLRAVPMKRVELSESEAARFLLRSGDLLFARRSLVAEGAGKCSVVLDLDEPTTFESSIIRARPDVSRADALFLYYYFNSRVGLHHLMTIRRQVAVAGITGADLARLELLVPPLSEQHAIANVLGALDDKIELNRQKSKTLEAIAKALFRTWFIDFEPVRAKEKGRDTRPDDQVTGLFPDRLVNSEAGEIPEGWRAGRLDDIAEQPRRTFRPESIVAGTPYIALEHMPRRSIVLSDWGSAHGLESNKFGFDRGEILFGKLRPYFHKVGVAPLDGVCSTDIVVVAPRQPHWSGLVLGVLSSDRFVDQVSAGATGTKMPRTSWQEMSRFVLALPPEAVAQAFSRCVGRLVERIIAATHESRTLATLRDTLLPKLISGELRIKDAERLVSEIV